MQFNVTMPIADLDGNLMRSNPADQDSAAIQVRSLLINALLLPRQSDAQLSGEEKFKRFQLAQKIHDNDVVELSAEDVSKLKQLIADAYTTLVYARLVLLLDPPGV